MRAIVLFPALPLIALTTCSVAQACDVPASYRVPTARQLVEQADAIVLARVTDGGPATFEPARKMGLRSARLVPFAAIKGNYVGRQIVFENAVLEKRAYKDLQATPSDARNLVNANPDAFRGSCNRVIFRPGMIVVAFLKRKGSDFIPFSPPFSRALEDVPNENSLWVKAVKIYAAIARKPKSLRRGEMQRQRDFLASSIDDPDDRLLALELDRALRVPTR